MYFILLALCSCCFRFNMLFSRTFFHDFLRVPLVLSLVSLQSPPNCVQHTDTRIPRFCHFDPLNFSLLFSFPFFLAQISLSGLWNDKSWTINPKSPQWSNKIPGPPFSSFPVSQITLVFVSQALKLRLGEARFFSWAQQVIPRTENWMQEFAPVLLCKYSTFPICAHHYLHLCRASLWLFLILRLLSICNLHTVHLAIPLIQNRPLQYYTPNCLCVCPYSFVQADISRLGHLNSCYLLVREQLQGTWQCSSASVSSCVQASPLTIALLMVRCPCPWQIFIRSTDCDRTLMSAETNLAGLYPPEGQQMFNPNISWQPIPVHTVPESEERVS